MDYPVRRRHVRAFSIGAAGLVIALLAMHAEGGGQGRRNQPAPSVRAAAPFDPTGYWSSLITQNWRLRMVPPAKGDYIGIPISAAGEKAADAWNQAKDDAAGNQMQGVWCARTHESADASAHLLAGRQHASRGHRLRNAEARVALRQLDAAGTAETELAGQLGRGLGIAARWTRRSG